jgi:hypothetical protein
VLDGAGHGFPIEISGEFNETVLSFLARQGKGGSMT